MALHPMGRQGGSSRAVCDGGSSIVLLQERFRQLQKMREKREEMELLNFFSGPETTSQTKHCEPAAKLSVHPEMIFHQPTTITTRPSFQDSISLGLNLYNRQVEPQPAKTPSFKDSWSVDSITLSKVYAREKPDVDTSLHL